METKSQISSTFIDLLLKMESLIDQQRQDLDDLHARVKKLEDAKNKEDEGSSVVDNQQLPCWERFLRFLRMK